jgi:hypothetical protein
LVNLHAADEIDEFTFARSERSTKDILCGVIAWLGLLYFEKGGLAIWYKGLEEGTFAAPKPSGNGQSVQLSG